MGRITVDYLLSEANSEHTYYTLFAQSYKKDSQNLYCFFEGHDDVKYYRIRIENFTQKDIDEWFYCGGKDNVLKAYNLIKQQDEYDLNRILFFIDKDYSSRKTNENIYVTIYYSIENFFTQRDVLIKIIKDEFKVSDNEIPRKDFDEILKLYDKLIFDFHSKTLFFNAWLACQNDKSEERKKTNRLYIDDKVKKYFSNIVSNDFKINKDFSDLNDILKIKNYFRILLK